MSSGLDFDFQGQFAGLELAGDRPVIISDADGVLLKFISGFEAFLDIHDYQLNLTRFALHGSIQHHANGAVASEQEADELLDAFFQDAIHELPAVAGAADHLARLADRADVVILTNLPHGLRARRQAHLGGHGFDFPVLTNSGPKGPAVRHIFEATKAGGGAPVFFIDDLPLHVASAAEHCPQAGLIHFVEDVRLYDRIEGAPEADLFSNDWQETAAFLIERLTHAGY